MLLHYSCGLAGVGMLATVECHVIESALTEPMMAMSNASISTPAMITIRIDWSIASLHWAAAPCAAADHQTSEISTGYQRSAETITLLLWIWPRPTWREGGVTQA